MDDNERKALEAAGEAVERAREDLSQNFSTQPRFTGEINPRDFFTSVFNWGKQAEEAEPDYRPNSRKRDSWLVKFARREPHLKGVLNSVTSIDKNRSWTLTGGRNQVNRFTDIFHSWVAAPGLVGWRAGISSAAMSYYATDMGYVIELGREGKGGPLRRFYHVDPTNCVLTGNADTPLAYFPPQADKQAWGYDDFIRGASNPNIEEKYSGLGFCAISRVVEIARLLIAVYEHDMEMMGAKAPRGLLLLKGINETQWKQAMEARGEELTGEGYQYFAPVAVLASMVDADAKLVALSQLPAQFDMKTFTDLMMFTYALSFGYDPIEFWPVQFGSLGRGEETAVQKEKATAKGGQDFARNHQEQVQDVLPDTLQFEYDERDDAGDLMAAQVADAWGKVITAISPFLSPAESRAFLAEHDIIPRHWAEIDQESESTDIADVEDLQGEDDSGEGDNVPAPDPTAAPIVPATKTRARMVRLREAETRRQREYLREFDHVYRTAEQFPDEPLVRYEWPKNRQVILWDRAGDLLKRSAWGGVTLKRADDSAELYHSRDVTITENDVQTAIDEGARRVSQDFADMLQNDPISE